MSRRESDVDIQGNWDKVFISCYRRTVYKGCIDIKNLLKKKNENLGNKSTVRYLLPY